MMIEGMELLRRMEPLAAPQCTADTKPMWYRPKGGRCPWRARYVTEDGRLLCTIHAKQEARALERAAGERN